MNLPPVYLIDASVYIIRAWFSVPDDFTNARASIPTPPTALRISAACEQTSATWAVAFDESLTTATATKFTRNTKPTAIRPRKTQKRQFQWARSIAECLGLAFADPR
jgi:hypothetical protein